MLGQALRPLAITPSQAEVIRVLQERGPLTLNGLGELLICESGTSPSRLVDRLVAAGLVKREVATHDRRHIELSLTAEGARLGQKIIKIEDDLYRSIDAAAEGHDLEHLFGFLRAFVADLPAGQGLSFRTLSPSTRERVGPGGGALECLPE